jgi:hypothetical protein
MNRFYGSGGGASLSGVVRLLFLEAAADLSDADLTYAWLDFSPSIVTRIAPISVA